MSKLNIVQIQGALLLPVTAQFIEQKLKIAPIEREKRAVFWSRDQFIDICQGLIAHVTAARNANFDLISAERPKKVEAAAATGAASDDTGFEFGDEQPAAKPAEPDNTGFEFGDEQPAAKPAEPDNTSFEFGDEDTEEEGFF